MARIEHKDIGDRLTPQATFTVAGSPTDPTQIVVKQQDPAGVESHVTTASSPATLTTASTPLARMSAGVFKLSPGIAATLAGHWFFRFEATGAAESAEDFQYDVDPSEFYTPLSARALVGLAETKDFLQVANVSTTNDLEIVRAINDVSELAHSVAEREFKTFDTTATARLFSVDDFAYRNRIVRVGDLASAPSLVRVLASDWTTVVSTVAVGDYTAHPTNRETWAPIRALEIKSTVLRPAYGQRVEVTGNWGFPAVPGHLRQAVLEAVAARLDRDVEHYSQDVAPRAEAGRRHGVAGYAASYVPARPAVGDVGVLVVPRLTGRLMAAETEDAPRVEVPGREESRL